MEVEEAMPTGLAAPFPYFGGKRDVAAEVWARFGNPRNYVEPYFGSGAVLFCRPGAPGVETVNDADCFLANFWRAVQQDPEQVATWADWPVNEADLHARHRWLVLSESSAEFRERMRTDPEYFDAKVAGWWVWGICQWIGSGWCRDVANPWQTRPHLEKGAGRGVHRGGPAPWQARPHLGNSGQGVHQVRTLKRPHLKSSDGVHRLMHIKRPDLRSGARGAYRTTQEAAGERADLYTYFDALAARLRRVRVCCGDWSRVCGPSPTWKIGMTAVFLDPPYGAEAKRQVGLYASDCLDVATAAREWAIENEGNRLMRIALCGYEGEHEMPDGWDCWRWKAHGGYGSQGDGRGRENAKREVIWFSPACLTPAQGALEFGE